jgi:hypothetical protein
VLCRREIEIAFFRMQGIDVPLELQVRGGRQQRVREISYEATVGRQPIETLAVGELQLRPDLGAREEIDRIERVM